MRQFLLLGLAILFGLIFLYPRAANFFRSLLSQALTPPVRGIHAIGRGFASGLSAAKGKLLFSADEQAFRRERESLIVDRVEFERLKRENEELRQSIGLGGALKRPAAYLEVIGEFNEGRDEYLIVSDADGPIGEGSPALSPQGSLIGIVRAVSGRSMTVRLISSPSETVTVSVLPSRTEAISHGDNNGEMLLTLVPENAEIHVGDPVVTSGRNNGLPAGLPIGTIAHIEDHGNNAFLDVRVKSSLSYDLLDHVIIVE